jgi:hypothetical protein
MKTGAAALVLAASACGPAAEGEPVILTVGGDSIIAMPRDTMSNGSVSADCEVVLQATVDGPAGEHIAIREGGVQYYWWQTGVPIELYTWSADSLLQLWPDTIMRAGEFRVARGHGFRQSEPVQPVRAEVRFRYAMSTRSGEHETDTFRYYCY